MDFLRPRTWADALTAKADHVDVVPIQGGTDVMVEMNFDLHRPGALLDLGRIDELTTWEELADGTLRVGAGVPYVRIMAELGSALPGIAQASRTVGSPQIRNRGTVGGNLGGASPAGDLHAPLLAAGAVVEVESSARGTRMIDADDFYVGVKRNSCEPDELIRAFHVAPAAGPQYFSKIGTRNSMVIAVCSFSIALFPDERRVGTGLGSAAPTPRRARAAEAFLAEELDWNGPLDDRVATRFGELVSEAASPIDDVRGTAQYRRHALSVMARRTLGWAWTELHTDGKAA